MHIITKESGIPLIGCIQFGIIDRGTNLLQIRPTSVCNLNCTFCSTAAGPFSKCHKETYEVELDYLLEWIKEVVEYKEGDVEANLDSVGEPLCYKEMVKLVKSLNDMKGINFISMQTNGTLLTKELVNELIEAGLKRINLSIETLDEEQAKILAGTKDYDLDHVINIAKYLSKKDIELFLTPVWIPNVNDKGIVDLIKFAKKIKARLGIQKYETYKYSRKEKKAKKTTYFKFYRQLEEWEKEFDIKLKLGPKDYNIYRKNPLPLIFKKDEKIRAECILPGWFDDQTIAIAKNRCITVLSKCTNTIYAKIIENKNNIYIAKLKS